MVTKIKIIFLRYIILALDSGRISWDSENVIKYNIKLVLISLYLTCTMQATKLLKPNAKVICKTRGILCPLVDLLNQALIT